MCVSENTEIPQYKHKPTQYIMFQTFGGVSFVCVLAAVVDVGIVIGVDAAFEPVFDLRLLSLVCVETSSIALEMRESVRSSPQPPL